MVKLFVLGATGYVGGDALALIEDKHSDWEITALVRNSDRGAKLAAKYPKVRLVYGDLDSSDLLEAEAAKADIILDAADADHMGSIAALIKGTVQHSASSPAFLVHVSGTGMLCHEDVKNKTFGTHLSSKVYDDWDNLSEVTSFPEDAFHRNVDKVILDSSAEHGNVLKTAIVAPPMIYGVGRGPVGTRSIQVPVLIEQSLKGKQAFTVNEGLAYWNQVHIHDLAELFLKLVEAAAEGGGKATWGQDGYYFADGGELVWKDVATLVAREAKKQGFLESDEIRALSSEEAAKKHPFGPVLWAANSRCKTVRAKKLLGWEPKSKGVEEVIPEAVRIEARSLGLIKGHAETVAG